MFIEAIAHLYNSAREIGGLDLPWPDLDFILETQGPERVFRGNPPTDPNDFLNRYYLSCSVSLAGFASDFGARHTDKYLPRASRASQVNCGMTSVQALERLIRDFYGPNPNDHRWVRRHAVFNHLHNQEETAGGTDESREVPQKLKDLRAAFAAFITKISPPRSRAERARTRTRYRSLTSRSKTRITPGSSIP